MTSTDGKAPPAHPTLEESLVPALAVSGGYLRAPWDPATGRALAALTIGWIWHVTVAHLLWIVVLVSGALVPALGVGLPLLAFALWAARGFAHAERSRLHAMTGVVIVPAARPRTERGRWAWLAPLRDGYAWKSTSYAFVVTLLSGLFFAVVASLAAGAVTLVVFVVLGGDSTLAREIDLPWPLTLLGALAGAVVMVWLAAVAAQYASYVIVRIAAVLLGVSATTVARARAAAAEREAREAAAAVTTARERADVLTESRAAVVSAADIERRRIERDLHDGAQQRLVALGVELGVARRQARTDPAAAERALDLAHGEIKETLAELRDLVRGIHPAVLSDRGLDAALSALAGRSPIPVEVEVDGDLDPTDPAARAAAYFVVAESLTNVAKHSGARNAWVRASLEPRDEPRMLRVVVSDDGRGGAAATPGSGLDGLAGRVAALDGTFELDSPTDGGTRLTVEVPCAS